jgi:type I restriction enzyme S subunit
MNDWKKVKFGDLLEIKHGFAFPGKNITNIENKNILVTPGNFYIGGGFKLNNKKYFTGEVPPEYILKENDLVVSMTDLSKMTDTLGFSAKIPIVNNKIFLHNQRIGLVRITSDIILKEYLYWLMRTKCYQKSIAASASGTSVKHTSPKRICEFETNLPPLPTQRRIADILSALDDKIENNRKTSEKLEEIAQSIFKRWFVDFDFPDAQGRPYKSSGGKMIESELGMIPEGWTTNKTKELFSYIVDNRGKTPPISKSGRRLVENWHISGDVIFPDFNKGRDQKYVSEETYSNWFRKGHPIAWDILYSTVGTLNKVSFVPPDCDFCIAQNIVAFRVDSELVSQFFFYNYMLSRHFVEQAHGRVIETVQASIKLGDIYTMDILVPKIKIIKHFDEIVLPIYEKIFNIYKTNKILQQTRDTLLPKLMSGELEV